jgi:CarD family transcriptional regulator
VIGAVRGVAAGAAFSPAMLFNVGDWVVHPLHGVGQVVRLEQKDFGTSPGQLYYEIAIPQGTLWVMAESPPAGLRELTAKTDLPRYRAVLQSAPTPLNKDYHQRRGELRERLKDGTFQVRCEVVRDLTAYGWRKQLSEPDATLLRTARDGLCQEWARAEAVTVAEALHEVEALLGVAKQKYRQ